MLFAFSRPHTHVAIPLRFAREFAFTTTIDGDEEGRIVLPPSLAGQAVSFQVGDDLSIYCATLAQTIWRGQIERIEKTKDGEMTIEALGFGFLQREAKISVVLQAYPQDTRWRVLESGDLPGTGFSSNPDLWQFREENGQIEIKTKTTFTINNSNLLFIAYVYEQPERYYWVGIVNQKIDLSNFGAYGLANGAWVAPIIDPPSPSSTQLQCGTFTLFTGTPSFVSAPGDCYGWVVGPAASGTETTPGFTRITFTPTVNLVNTSSEKLTDALTARGGVCKITSFDTFNIRKIKPDASLPDFFKELPETYRQKRFIRDGQRPTIHFFSGEKPFVWLFPEVQSDDISQRPGRFFATFVGALTTHTTNARQNIAVESKRRLTPRYKEEGHFSSSLLAESYLNEVEQVYKAKKLNFSADFDNSRYELRTPSGTFVPNWAADVGDLAILPNVFAKVQIKERSITKERTSYIVEDAQKDALAALRGL